MSDNIYNFKLAQSKWAKILGNYSVSNDRLLQNVSKKYYVLSMLPYPSGNLHMGHIRNYTIGDVITRVKHMQGYTVIQPMGFDSFGMPAENAAIKSGVNPREWTEKNIQEMTNQLQAMGYAYDWNRTVSTHSTEYYTQEQKIFLKFFEMGLAYRKQSYVNWDPVDCTVLANEQVIDGKGWRSGATVEKKLLEQWSIKITKYAEELLEGLKELNGHWPEKVLKMQENWIGKSQGAIIHFKIAKSGEPIDVYSTRPDTLFGASFIAISPDHPIAQHLAESNAEISKFIADCKKSGTTEEELEKAEKKGLDTGLKVEHPLIKDKTLPVYIANFVLMDYGTGAVFACPAHDERDYDFAKKYNLSIIPVIENNSTLPYVGDGIHINSDFLNGLNVADAKTKIIDFLEEHKLGERKVTYRLRDWLVSRQRYWGCPIPIVHCDKCGLVPAKLPVLLPEDIDFKDLMGNPLEKHPTWKYTKCPKCGNDAVRDTDTLDTFFESSWYFLRYLDAHNTEPINKNIADAVIPADICIGGVEHAVLHLLYARFFMLALRDAGYISTSVPFKNLLCQGMVCHKSYKNEKGDWVFPSNVIKNTNNQLVDDKGLPVTEYPSEKMSKSKKNVISPEEIIATYGVDALRLFILSDTPPEKDFDWNTSALEGSWRFLNRVWKVFNQIQQKIKTNGNSPEDKSLIKTTHIYLKKITEEYETISLNKAIALAREFFNKIEDNINNSDIKTLSFAFETFIKVFSPITPFLCQEIWDVTHPGELIHDAEWQKYDENLSSLDTVTIAIQVNGKLRNTITVAKDLERNTLEGIALKTVLSNFDKTAVKKVIVVTNKVVNFVV